MNKTNEWLATMTPKQKLAQMICTRSFDYREKIESMISEGLIGSIGGTVIVVNGTKELEGVVETINHFKSLSKLPLRFYLDAEIGVSHMFDFGTTFPSMMALGATFSKELAYKMGHVIAKEARVLGFSIVSNPVLDINSNPDNPIINTRAMSDDPSLIIELASEYVKGMDDAGVIPSAKHFPGHGDTSIDSHVSMPIVEHSKEYLMEVELKTFRELVKRGMKGIMTAHILYPALLGEEEDRVPATLSRGIMTNLLREEFGFDGLIISDSLAMKGIKNLYSLEDSAVMAVHAGHDIILQDYSTDPEWTLNALQDALESGKLDEKQIQASVRRNLTLYEQQALDEDGPIDLEQVKRTIECEEHQQVAREVADRSVTLLEAKQLPLRSYEQKKILVVGTRSHEEGKASEDLYLTIKEKVNELHEKCLQYAKDVDVLPISEDPTQAEIEKVKEISGEYDVVIYAAFVRVMSYKEHSGTIPPSQIELIHYLNEQLQQSVFIIFGSPYVLRKLNRLNNSICTYSDCEYSIDASLKVLFGSMQAQGKLPVNINETYTYGYGLS